MFEIIKPNTRFEFMRNRKKYYIFSGVLVSLALISIITRWAVNGSPLNFGIDFTGGTEIQLSFKEDVKTEEVRAAMKAMGFEAEVQSIETGGETIDYLLRIREQVTVVDANLAEKIRADLANQTGALGTLVRFQPAASGDRIYVKFDRDPDQSAIKNTFQKLSLTLVNIERTGRPQDNTFTLHLEELQTKIGAHFQKSFDKKFHEIARVQLVGPKAGEQLRNAGLLSVLISMLLIALYIAVRFDFRFSIGALMALIHDPIVIIGCFSLFWWEFSLNGIAALLTVVGYSINDTIIVFDRIREMIGGTHDKNLEKTANLAINETLSRTMITSGLTLTVVVALFLFGGSLLREFSVALMLGIVVGTYSSIGIASGLMLDFDRYMPRLQALFGPKKTAAVRLGKGD